MLLVRSATIRKIARALGVSAGERMRGAISQTAPERAPRARLNIEVQLPLRQVVALLLFWAFAAALPSLALAQSDLRRPVRQVEMDDGVIEITNSHAADRGADQVTSIRALQASPTRDQPRDSSNEEDDVEPPAVGAAQGTAQGNASSSAATSGSTATASWLLPFIVVVLALGIVIWGLRRRGSVAMAPAHGAGSASHGALDDDEAVFDTHVLDEPAAVDGGHLDSGHLDGQWALAVRDSVPPSSPPRSSRGANAPRQWVSQPLRVKSDQS